MGGSALGETVHEGRTRASGAGGVSEAANVHQTPTNGGDGEERCVATRWGAGKLKRSPHLSGGNSLLFCTKSHGPACIPCQSQRRELRLNRAVGNTEPRCARSGSSGQQTPAGLRDRTVTSGLAGGGLVRALQPEPEPAKPAARKAGDRHTPKGREVQASVDPRSSCSSLCEWRRPPFFWRFLQTCGP